MKIPRAPHRWDITPARAIEIQKTFSSRISLRPADHSMDLIAGGDVAFTPDGSQCIAGVVVWDAKAKRVVETQAATGPLNFPYVPGLLSFREAPTLLRAIRRLKCNPDAFLFDGQGLAHPRRFGLACHMGVLIDRPSAGCAKSRLIGDHTEPAARRGSRRPLTHNGQRIGTVLRTRSGVKPLYVSVGHRISLDQAVELVLRCGHGYRLPEPTRLADQLVSRLKRTGPPFGKRGPESIPA